ncbi:hypothetical protein QUB10_15045 [Microcoleus sp. B5-D4]|uniref:hypothetical protein n=1 Tax=unclassified Microcoleus TaxID=2642155 RepID=UPI002FD54E9F
MVTHNISVNISETAFQRDIYPSKKAEKLSSQQHFLTDAVRQCVKVYQLEPRDWQQFSQTIHPSCVGDISSEKKERAKALGRGFRFVLMTVHQCIQILNTKPIVWRQFYRE